MALSSGATVVVSRRVRPEERSRFRRWLNQLLKAVRFAEGYIGAAVEPPDDAHPDHWVVRYHFATNRDLDNWLVSAKRVELLERGRGFLVDPPIEQRILQPTSDSLTLISSVRLRPGTEQEHRTLHEAAVEQARRLGGLVRAELIPAHEGSQPETVALLTFATQTDLDCWLNSVERREVLDSMSELVENSRTTTVVGGFAGWFSGDAAAPRKWKQALTVFAALIPISILVTATRDFVAPGLPLLLSIAITSASNVVLLTWIAMPPLTHVLRSWLRR